MFYLETEDIVKKFANHTALDSVSVGVKEGSVFGLLGPNGAGKTTLIRIINQITAPDTGSVRLKGRALNPDDVYNIGYLPEERGLYRKMKVGEQALYFAQLKGVPKAQASVQLRQWFRKFEIESWWDKKVEELSKGMQQKVQFIITVIHKPQLLIFDEPFSGFDPINTNLLKTEILELKKQGTTIIFSTHNMSSVEEICDEIALIDRSRVILNGDVDEIKNRYKTNRIRIEISDTSDIDHNLLGNGFAIEESSNIKNGRQMVVAMSPGSTINELLSVVIPKFQITKVEEVIPSMNDIFIRVVEANNS